MSRILANVGKLLWDYEIGLLPKFMKKHYYQICNIKTWKIRELSAETAMIDLDLRALDIIAVYTLTPVMRVCLQSSMHGR
ncbi:MAG: hypothetical protein QXQ41_05745 [Candidatus Bathyarchaeia archaeon]